MFSVKCKGTKNEFHIKYTLKFGVGEKKGGLTRDSWGTTFRTSTPTSHSGRLDKETGSRGLGSHDPPFNSETLWDGREPRRLLALHPPILKRCFTGVLGLQRFHLGFKTG